MLKLNQNYSDYTDETDVDYPEGKAVNASTSESYDGTPLLAEFMNDVNAAHIAMYEKAHGSRDGINGQADTQKASQFADSVAKYTDDKVKAHADERGLADGVHGATSEATPGQIASRDEFGNLKVGAAINDDDAINLGEVKQKFEEADLKEASHRGVDTVVTADSENVPTSGAVEYALKDATNRITDAWLLNNQAFGYCDNRTLNVPYNFAWGVRELKFISANQVIVKLIGVTEDAVLHYWIAVWNFGTWGGGWKEITDHNEDLFSGGQFTAANNSQNILTVTDIEGTRAGFYDVDIDFVTYGKNGFNYTWDYCSVFFMNKSTGAIISGNDLNQAGIFGYDFGAGVPNHNSSHGVRYLEPGHYGLRVDVNKAGTYEAYLWIHGRS